VPSIARSLQFQENSHTLNEATCPINEDTLSNLCGTDTPDATAIALAYPPKQRAQLAYFCYNRQHMKALADTLILSCEKSDLRVEFAGITDVVIEQAKAELKVREATGQPRSLKPIGYSPIR
jgi:hypothetical protein